MTATAQQDTPTQTPPAVLPPHSVPGAPLRAALAHLGRVIPARSSNPLLTGLLMRAQDGVLTLGGTNLESDWEIKLDAPQMPDFVTAVSAARLGKFLALTGKQARIPLALEGRQLALYAEEAGTLLRLPTLDVADFPPLNFPALPMTAATVPAGELATALRSVLYASSDEAFQAIFRGICVATRADGLSEVVASDGYRVAIYRLGVALPDMILPRTVVGPLLRRLEAADPAAPIRVAALGLGSDPDQPATDLRFDIGEDTRVRCKGLDGQFPDYDRVMLRGAQVSGEWNRAPLVARLKVLALMADRNANNRVEITQTGTLLTLRAECDAGEAVSALDLDAPLGGAPSVSAAYNLAHLQQAAANAPAGLLRVGIQHTDPKDTTKRTLELQCGNYRAVIVCLRA